MAKLTLTQRDAIVSAILQDTFNGRQIALKKREHALAVKIIIDKYGKDAFAQFDAVPTGWLTTANQFLIRHHGNTRWLCLEEARALPHELTIGRYELEEHPKLLREYEGMLTECSRLSMERQQLQTDTAAALRAFGTEAALRDGWPEAHAYLTVPRVMHQLPAVRIEDLNRRIAALKEAA